MKYFDIEQGSPEWISLRTGKLTGSNFGKIVKSNYLELVDQIVSEQLTGFVDYDFTFENENISRGKELEPVAIESYSKITGNEIIKCGFIQSDQFDFVGSSPDGIFKDGSGIIEIKCPKPKNHIKYIRQGKIPSEHIGQVISYFIVDPEIKFVDFISFCPDLEVKPIWIKRIERIEAEEMIQEYTEAILKFQKNMEKLKQDLTF